MRALGWGGPIVFGGGCAIPSKMRALGLYCPSRNLPLHLATIGVAYPRRAHVRWSRRSFTAAQKSTILKRHHVDKVPVSKVCEETNIQPSQFYLWQGQAFENLVPRRSRPGGKERALQDKVDRLEARLARKDHVIAIISLDHVAHKNELGEP